MNGEIYQDTMSQLGHGTKLYQSHRTKDYLFYSTYFGWTVSDGNNTSDPKTLDPKTSKGENFHKYKQIPQ